MNERRDTRRELLGAVCTAVLAVTTVAAVPNVADAASVSGSGTWETTLQGRDLDGNLATFEAYYDTALNITWLADANAAGAAMNWVNANTWVASLNPYSSGITDWRLPTVTDTGTPGCSWGADCGFNIDPTTGEMAYMFHVTLGNLPRFDNSYVEQLGGGLANTGPFSNLGNFYWWSATERTNRVRLD